MRVHMTGAAGRAVQANGHDNVSYIPEAVSVSVSGWNHSAPGRDSPASPASVGAQQYLMGLGNTKFDRELIIKQFKREMKPHEIYLRVRLKICCWLVLRSRCFYEVRIGAFSTHQKPVPVMV